MRCGRLLREREPVAVFFTGKGNENTWKILAFNMRTVSQDRQKNQWIYGRKNLADMSEELMNDPMAVVRA